MTIPTKDLEREANERKIKERAADMAKKAVKKRKELLAEEVVTPEEVADETPEEKHVPEATMIKMVDGSVFGITGYKNLAMDDAREFLVLAYDHGDDKYQDIIKKSNVDSLFRMPAHVYNKRLEEAQKGKENGKK
jgi:hypothetical protein